ncbi:MAG: CapA family protein [Planctomycetota bacterium]
MAAGVLVLAAGCGGGGEEGTPPPLVPDLPAAGLVHFALVGDTTSARVLVDADTDPLADVGYLLDPVDLFVFNQEGVLGPSASTPAGCAAWPQQSLFYAPAWTAATLRRGQATIATLANNHVLDCGAQGLLETRDVLADLGMATQGAGADADAAGAPHTVDVRGTSVTLLSYLAMDRPELHAGPAVAGAATWLTCDGAGEVAAAKARGDIVVVALHLHQGPGWTEATHADDRALIEAALDAGADIVVGHGPHVPQAVITRPGQVAFASLGNFLFGLGSRPPETAARCIVADVRLHADRLDIALVPFRIHVDGTPRRASEADAALMLEALRRASLLEGTAMTIRDSIAYVSVQR